MAQDKVSPHIDALVKKTGPVGSFISSKIPVRTAGSTVGEEIATEPEASATTTGASKFPEIPVESNQTPNIHEFVENEVKSSPDF